MPTTIAFTGYRPKKLYGYTDTRSYSRLFDALRGAICEAYAHGVREVITGGAQGLDQVAFFAANAAKASCPGLVNTVYVPFPGQEKAWPEDTMFGQKEYRSMLSLADNVHYVSQAPSPANAARLLFARNEAMVDAADLVLGVFRDSDDLYGRGGTAGCLRYAKQKDRTVWALDPDTLAWRAL